MPKTSENAKIEYEGGFNFFEFQQLTDDGDHMTFNSPSDLWSGRYAYQPKVRPNGLITGGEVKPGDNNDEVAVAALTCFLAGVKTSVASGTVSISRPSSDVAQINSITVDSTGSLVEVTGSEGSDQNFSSTRGAAGGPPYIPTDSIEIAQVRLTSSASAKLESTQIRQLVGESLERYDYPLVEPVHYGGKAVAGWAMPLIHSDDGGSTEKTKAVWAEWYEPKFVEIPYASNMVLPENSHSVNTTQVYNGSLASVSTSLGQGSFTGRLKDGITDGIMDVVDDFVWIRFHPDRYADPHYYCQGKLGISRSFPAGDYNQGEFTISATEKAKGEVA